MASTAFTASSTTSGPDSVAGEHRDAVTHRFASSSASPSTWTIIAKSLMVLTNGGEI